MLAPMRKPLTLLVLWFTAIAAVTLLTHAGDHSPYTYGYAVFGQRWRIAPRLGSPETIATPPRVIAIVPARNEALELPHTLSPLQPRLRKVMFLSG